jgi:hypothetical protein
MISHCTKDLKTKTTFMLLIICFTSKVLLTTLTILPHEKLIRQNRWPLTTPGTDRRYYAVGTTGQMACSQNLQVQVQHYGHVTKTSR